MFVPNPARTGAIVKNIAELFKLLRDRQTDKDFFDIVRDLQTEETKLEATAKDAEAEVTRLYYIIAEMKDKHVAEIARLKKTHSEEIRRVTAVPGRATPYMDESGWGFRDPGDLL